MPPVEAIRGWLELGVGGFLVSALILGYRRIWVFGWIFTQVLTERDEWKTLALHLLQLNSDQAQAAKQHTTLTPEQADMALRIVRDAGRLRDGKP